MEECSVGFVAGAQRKSDIHFTAIIAADVSTTSWVLERPSAAELINQDDKLIAFLHMSILPQARPIGAAEWRCVT
jgi:hypothetical protein